MMVRARYLAIAFAAAVSIVSCAPGRGTDSASGSETIVIYSALDREFAEPILKEYERRSHMRIDGKYDVESTKTVGLTHAIMLEANRPRCDLFWNNEILNTLRLKRAGLLAPFSIPNADDFPATFRDRDQTWYGFAARARIILVNVKLVTEKDRPRGIEDLLDPRWKGKIGFAKPLFGTTATHAACLFAKWGDDKAKLYFDNLKKNDVRVLSGNRQVAQAVGSGSIAFGLTDTDDASEEIAAGSPVAIVYPDRGKDELGTLYIPNTLALVKGAPHAEAAIKTARYLLSPEVEIALATGPSAQIPLNSQVNIKTKVETPITVKAMEVDFEAAAVKWDAAAAYLAEKFGAAE